MPNYFSPSSLAILERCDLCWYLQRLLKIGREGDELPSLPAGMDRIIKEQLDEHRKLGTVPSYLDGWGLRLSKHKDLKKWQDTREGIQWEDPDGNIVRGALDDLLVDKNNYYVPFDTKTRGYAPTQFSSDKYILQMSMYEMLLQLNGYPTKGYALLGIWHPKGATNNLVDFNVNLVKVETDVEYAKGLCAKAARLVKGPMPDASPHCGTCNWVVQRAFAMSVGYAMREYFALQQGLASEITRIERANQVTAQQQILSQIGQFGRKKRRRRSRKKPEKRKGFFD